MWVCVCNCVCGDQNPPNSLSTHLISSLTQAVPPQTSVALSPSVSCSLSLVLWNRFLTHTLSLTGQPPSQPFTQSLGFRLYLNLLALAFNVLLLVVICVISSQSEAMAWQGRGRDREVLWVVGHRWGEDKERWRQLGAGSGCGWKSMVGK